MAVTVYAASQVDRYWKTGLCYDKATDTLLIVLTSHPIEETEEIRTAILADIDESGGLVSLEILNASRKVEAFQEMISSVQPAAVALEMQ